MTTTDLAFDRQLRTLLYVAGDRARREGRPMAVERCAVHWTVRDAARPTPPDYERLTILEPHQYTEEARMGVAKKLHTARMLGQPVSATLLRTFGHGPTEPTPRGPRHDDDLASAITSHRLMTTLLAVDATVAAAAAELAKPVEPASSEPAQAAPAITPPWVDPALTGEPKPTRRELALRRSCGPPRPPRVYTLDLDVQFGAVPEEIWTELRHAVGELLDYRAELERSRGLARRFGGGRRYINDVRRNRRQALLGVLPTIRKFVRTAPDNCVNPYVVLFEVMVQIAATDPAVIKSTLNAIGIDLAIPGTEPSAGPQVPRGPAPEIGPYGATAAPSRRGGRRKAPTPGQINMFDFD